MATKIGQLFAVLSLNASKFNRGLDRARKKSKRFGFGIKNITSVVKSFGAALGAVTAGAAIFKLGKATEGLNRALLQSQAIMGVLDETMKRVMQKRAIQVARTTKFSAEEAAKAYFFLASAGLSASQSIAALPRVAKFAQAGTFDLSVATDLLTDAQSALGLTVKDTAQNMRNMARVSDVLVGANTLANASVELLSQALTTKAGAALKAVGKDIEEGVALLAAFADQGIKSAEAGTALNIVFRDLQTKALKNVDAFKKHKIAVFDANEKMNNIADIIGDVEMALAGMTDAGKKATLMQLGFSDKSVIFLQTLIGTSEKIRDYETSLRSMAGITDTVANKTLSDFTKGWAQLSAAVTNFASIFQPVVDTLGGFLEGLSRRINDVALGFRTVGAIASGNLQGFVEQGIGDRAVLSGGSAAISAAVSNSDVVEAVNENTRAVKRAAVDNNRLLR